MKDVYNPEGAEHPRPIPHVPIGIRVSYYGTQNFYQGEYRIVGHQRPSHSPEMYEDGLAYVLRNEDVAPSAPGAILHDVRRATFELKD
jgi:hypothetical protein